MTREGKNGILNIADKLEHVTSACEERKANEIIVLDVRELTLIADYFVICNGNSRVHIDAIVEHVVQTLKGLGDKTVRVEGSSSTGWVLIDCGDILVNVFDPPQRDYYGLERLWGDAEESEVISSPPEHSSS